jgi:hypothetical protein
VSHFRHEATDALFAKARQLDAPDHDARDRMRRAVLVAKIVVPLLLVGTAVTGALTLAVPTLSPAVSFESFESPTRSATRSEENVFGSAPHAVIALESKPLARPATRPAHEAIDARARAPKEDADGSSRADLRDLEEVERMLARGDAEAALALLDARAARRPRSVFAEELEGARVLALCSSTRSEEAGRARATFGARYPVSPIASRIDRACTAKK